MERYWHTRCLKCSCCHAQLGEYSSTCYSKGGMILCKNDYIRLFGHSGACSSCGQSIPASEMVMRAQGNVYHLKCFTCATCRNRLVPGDRFHYVNGTIFCEHDRPGGGLLSGHPPPLQNNSMLSDQKVCWGLGGKTKCVPSPRPSFFVSPSPPSSTRPPVWMKSYSFRFQHPKQTLVSSEDCEERSLDKVQEDEDAEDGIYVDCCLLWTVEI